MSSFELQGTVQKIETRQSAKGNPYIVFQVVETAGNTSKVYEMSLYGDGLQYEAILKKGARVLIKGNLGSREYTDSKNCIRYGLQLNVRWVEPVKGEKAGKTKAVELPEADDSLNEIPF